MPGREAELVSLPWEAGTLSGDVPAVRAGKKDQLQERKRGRSRLDLEP